MRTGIRLVLIAAASIVFVFNIFPQSRSNSSGTGGVNTIQGRVFLPNGRSPNASVRVQLQSTSYSTLTVDTDQSGAFSFRSLSAGNYTILVEAGDVFDAAREYVTIDPDVQIDPRLFIPTVPKTFNVPVYLQFKRTISAPAGVVNARLAGYPKDAVKHYEKGLELNRGKKPGEALAEFTQAVNIYPQFAQAFVEIGKINLTLDKTDAALEAFRRAAGLDAKNYEARLGYGIALFEKKDSAAATELKTAAEINTAAAHPHYYLAMIEIQQKKWTEAQKEFELTEKLKGEREFPMTHKLLGGIYWSQKLYEKAADELEKYVKLSPDSKDTEQIRKTIAELRQQKS